MSAVNAVWEGGMPYTHSLAHSPNGEYAILRHKVWLAPELGKTVATYDTFEEAEAMRKLLIASEEST